MDCATHIARDDAAFSQDRKRRLRLHEAVQAAIDFYHRRLLDAPDAGNARGYLRSRGFDGDVARRFSLGWAPDGFDVGSARAGFGAPEFLNELRMIALRFGDVARVEGTQSLRRGRRNRQRGGSQQQDFSTHVWHQSPVSDAT